MPANEIGIATATHPARLGCKNKVNISSTSIKPMTPFLVRRAILCSIIIELSCIISAVMFWFTLLKFSRYALVFPATILMSSLLVLKTLTTTPAVLL